MVIPYAYGMDGYTIRVRYKIRMWYRTRPNLTLNKFNGTAFLRSSHILSFLTHRGLPQGQQQTQIR